jgi:hypothetical protein
MRKMILVVVLALSGTCLSAQNKIDTTDTRPRNNIYVNLLGDASIMSINYERLFLINPCFFLAGKFGLGYNEKFQLSFFGKSTTSPEPYITIPFHITSNFGKGRHFFEFGLGGTIINKNDCLYPILGYRFQPIKSGDISFRIFGSIPFSGNEPNNIFFIPFGLSVGVSF